MSSALPNILHHYTNSDGLLGIFRESAFWATKIHYLNDSSELVEPFNTAKEYLTNLKNVKYSKSVEDLNEEKEIIESMLYEIEVNEGLNIFVASFCMDGDLLSQWRGYGSPEPAYSIGFKSNKLVEILGEHSFELHKCEYFDPSHYRDNIQHFIDVFIDETKKEPDKRDTFIWEFIKMASIMKHDCFQEENEYRIISVRPVSYVNENINFRPGTSMLIPYYSLPLDLPSVIGQITIGPCPNPDLANDAIQGLAYKYGLYNPKSRMLDISIRNSSIPFRPI